MDGDTIVIMGLLAAALSFWFKILIKEEVQAIKQSKRDAIDQIERTERVRRLTNKF